MRSDVLARFPLASSDDPTELIHNLRRMYDGDIRAVGEIGTGPRYELRGVAAPTHSVGYIRSGLGVQVGGPRTAGSYFVNFAISGSLISSRGGDPITNTRGVAAVFNPGEPQILRPTAAETETLGIRVARSLVEDELTALLGRPADGPLRFDFGLVVASPAQAALVQVVESMVDQFDSGHALFEHPAMQLAQVRAFVTSLLLSHRHNFSILLHEGFTPPRPRTLRRALDYVEAHLAEPIMIGDLARAAGCSARTLNGAFHDQFGCSPMTFVRNRRLERIREDLMSSDASVSTVAHRWGFAHLGRLSGAYQARFGELPSATQRP